MIKTVLLLSLLSVAAFSSSDKCLAEYTKAQGLQQSPNAMIEALKYKKAIARSFEEINELIQDLESINPVLAKKVNIFFHEARGLRYVDGGAGLSIYGLELAMKGASVKAFSGQNFLSLLKYFENPDFMERFIPAAALREDALLFSVKNLNRIDITDGFPSMEFPIKGEVLAKIAQVTNNKEQFNKYAYMVGVATAVEIRNMRQFVSGMIKQYSQRLQELIQQKKFSYHHMLDHEFYRNEIPEANAIDRYIDFNGVFYYKKDKIGYLDLLLKKLAPGGKAILILDSGNSRFTVNGVSLAKYLSDKWPTVFSHTEIRHTGIFNESLTQQVLFIEKPLDEASYPLLSEFLEVESNSFSADAHIPKTTFKEKTN